MKRPYGMAPVAFEQYIKACCAARISPERIAQTIGNAPASAGVHKQDGTVVVGGKTYPYCAATDIGDNGLSLAQKRRFLDALAAHNFGGWYRDWTNNTHFHVIYPGLDMKESLFLQLVDFLNDRTGLVGHAHETFYTAPAEYDRNIARELKRANPKLWEKYEARIPAPYRNDEPARLFVNNKLVRGAVLNGAQWLCQEGALAPVLGAVTQTESLIVPVMVLAARWGWKKDGYTQRIATRNRADLRLVRA